MHAESPAAKLYKQGKNAEDHSDPINTYEAYKKAHTLDSKEVKYLTPERVRFAAAAEYVHQGENSLRQTNLRWRLLPFTKRLKSIPATSLPEQDAKQTPEEDRGEEASGRKIRVFHARNDEAGPPPASRFRGLPNLFTLHVTGAERCHLPTIGKTAGLNVLVDLTIRLSASLSISPTSQPKEALRIVGDQSNTFYKPVTHNTIFIAQNSKTKRQAVEERAVQVFYLSNIGQQSDLNDIQTALRNVLAIQCEALYSPQPECDRRQRNSR